MQSLLVTVAREFRVAGWKSPTSPVTDAVSPNSSSNTGRKSSSTTVTSATKPAVKGSGKGTFIASTQELPEGAPHKKRGSLARVKEGQADDSSKQTGLDNSRQLLKHREQDSRNNHGTLCGEEGLSSRKRQRVPYSKESSSSDNKKKRASMRGLESGASSSTSDSDCQTSSATGRSGENPAADSATCQYDGCSKTVSNPGRRFCRRHGEGRRCKTLGCNKVDVGGGSCRKHGGGRRCGAEGCLKTDVGGGFCVSHGGGKRCQAQDCAKGAQAGGIFCKSHGGGRRCRIEGCMTSAQSGADILCIKHGGGKRCLVSGCRKLVRKNNRCTKHAAESTSIASESPSESRTASSTPPLQKSRSPVKSRTSQPPSFRRSLEPMESTRGTAANASSPRRPGDNMQNGRYDATRRHSDSSPDPLEPSLWSTMPLHLPGLARLDAGTTRGVAGSSSHGARQHSPSLSPPPFPISHQNREASARGVRMESGNSLPQPTPSLHPSHSLRESRLRRQEHHQLGGFSTVALNQAQRSGAGATVSHHGAVGVVTDPSAPGNRASTTHPGVRLALPLPGVSELDARAGVGASGVMASRQRETPRAMQTARRISPEPSSGLSSAVSLARTGGGGGGGPAGSVPMPPRGIPPSFALDVPSRQDGDRGRGGGVTDGGAWQPQRTESLPAVMPREMQHRRSSHLHHQIRPREGERENSPSLSPPHSPISQPPMTPSFTRGINSYSTARTTPEHMDDISESASWQMSREGRDRSDAVGAYDDSSGSDGNMFTSPYSESVESSRMSQGYRPSDWRMTRCGNGALVPNSVTVQNGAVSYSDLMPLSTANNTARTSVNRADDVVRDNRDMRPLTQSTSPFLSRFDQGSRQSGSYSAGGYVVQSGQGSMGGSLAGLDPRGQHAHQRRAGGGCCSVGSAGGGGGRASPSLVAGGVARESISPVNGFPGDRRRSSVSPTPAPTYISLSVEGMMCMQNCGQTVQRVLGAVEGVRCVTVHFPTRTASVQIEPGCFVPLEALTSALDAIGFRSSCVATSTTEETIEEPGVNAVWAIASALGLVDRGCAMAWGESCNCGDNCKCVNCPQHMRKVSQAVDLVVKAMDLSKTDSPTSSPEKIAPSASMEQIAR